MDTKRFGNPFFSENSFHDDRFSADDRPRMTHGGTALWLLFLLCLFGLTYGYTMNKGMIAFKDIDFNLIKDVDTGKKDKDDKPITEVKYEASPGNYVEMPKPDLTEVTRLMWIGSVGGLAVGLCCIFNRQAAPILAPIYALLEGLAIGGISAAYELEFRGIAMQAGAGTVAVLIVMYFLYVSGFIRVTGFGTTVLTSLLLGVLGVYVTDIFLSALGGEHLDIVHSNSASSIAFSVFVCGLAAWCLAVDFQTIEDGVRSRAPKYMNAYAAFSVLVTLVWLYLEILRLVAKKRK